VGWRRGRGPAGCLAVLGWFTRAVWICGSVSVANIVVALWECMECGYEFLIITFF